MVNYQGPEAIRGLVEAMEIPIFNRVKQINYMFKDLGEIQLDKKDVARMHELEQISVSKRGEKLVTESDVKAVGDIVPPLTLGFSGQDKEADQYQVKPRVYIRVLLAVAISLQLRNFRPILHSFKSRSSCRALPPD